MKYNGMFPVLAFFIMLLSPVIADQNVYDEIDLTALSIEELMDIEVTSVSKKAEKLSETSAAVYVITQDEIKRSGIASLPELFRLVPGMQVGRTDSSKWSISARGFNEIYANKLLVMVDGRSVYTPTFSGVFWDMQDIMLEDIERIEVIRGPGATVWGANAVNGVINIITKSAADTEGMLASAGIGNGDEEAVHAFRYGSKIGDKGSLRVYAKNTRYEGFPSGPLGETENSWVQDSVGFRADWENSDKSGMTLLGSVYNGMHQGDYFTVSLLSPYVEKVNSSQRSPGRNLLLRWTKPVADGAGSTLQVYYDEYDRYHSVFNSETRSTWDIDYQRQQASGRHQIMWGLGYRNTHDVMSDYVESMQYIPSVRTDNLFSAFVQDDIELKPDKMKLTVGTKFEHNSYTGFEVQPTVRICYTPSHRETMWASISRAVRSPSRAESDIDADFSLLFAPDWTPILVKLAGSDDYESEVLTAYEIGYRIQPSPSLSFDAAAFFNDYSNLRTLEPQTMGYSEDPIPHYILPLRFENLGNAEGVGAEIVANWQVSGGWRITATGSWLNLVGQQEPASQDATFGSFMTLAPKYQYSLRSYADLSDRLQFNALAFFVGGAKPPAASIPCPDIPAYTRLDMNLVWRTSHNLDVSLGVRNALDSGHFETGSTLGELPTYIEQSWYAKATWRN